MRILSFADALPPHADLWVWKRAHTFGTVSFAILFQDIGSLPCIAMT